MSLAHAILGFLRDGARTGYELKTRAFDQGVQHFWAADQAQIYRTLESILTRGWASAKVQPQQGRPDRKVYQITAAGRKELERWVAENRSGLPAVREPVLVQLFFSDGHDTATVRAILADQKAKHVARLATYQAVPLPPLDAKGIDSRTRLQRMTLELGLRIEQAYLDWIEACEQSLDEM